MFGHWIPKAATDICLLVSTSFWFIDINEVGPCLHFVPLYNNEAKASHIQALPSWAGDVIWSQTLHSD